MKVPTVGPTAPSTATGRARRVSEPGGAKFSEHLDKAEATESGVEGTSGVYGVSAAASILAAQEVEDHPDQAAKKQLVRHGEELLDKLEEVRRELLAGGLPRERLENLAQAMRSRRAHVSDPKLIEIIDEIELRAQVEIAKYSRTI